MVGAVALAAVATRNDVFVSALVEGLSRSGLRHVCISPGSRNTPLSLAFAAHPDITDWSHHDERSGSFFALGLAVATGSPVAVVTTSGTAAAELHAAVVEADATGVPLVVLTADRPAELFDVAAPQTIDQRSLYAGAVRWHHDLDVPEPADAGPRVIAALAARLVQEATTTPTGPVHLNVRFREPLVVDPDFSNIPVPEIESAVARPTPDTVAGIIETIGGRRGVVVAGPSREHDLPGAVTRLAGALGWPILADPISGLRVGTHPVYHVVGSDLLAAAGVPESLAPEIVLRIGAPPTSKSLRNWLATSGVRQLLIAPGRWPDPDASATTVVRADTAATLEALADSATPVDADWMGLWAQTQAAASDSAIAVIRALEAPSEPGVALALAGSTPDGAAIWAASSMPIRDVDSYFPVTSRPVRLFGNRGANGIDGLASSALGTAATGTPTIAHLGDLSMLHDVGSLATAARLALPVTFLVVNNDGGGIFHFLPQAGHEHFERHFGTPHGLRFSEVAAGFGVEAVTAESMEDVETAIAETGPGPRLVEVFTDRDENVRLHREIAAAARDAVVGL